MGNRYRKHIPLDRDRYSAQLLGYKVAYLKIKERHLRKKNYDACLAKKPEFKSKCTGINITCKYVMCMFKEIENARSRYLPEITKKKPTVFR